MQKHDMQVFANPELKIIGDCYRTCIACLLDMHPLEVPHFMASTWGDWETRKWLKPRGLMVIEMRCELVYNGWLLDREDIDLFHIMCGMTERGLMHAVVGRNGKVYHDPHPSRAGLLSATHMEFLIPLSYTHVGAINADTVFKEAQ